MHKNLWIQNRSTATNSKLIMTEPIQISGLESILNGKINILKSELHIICESIYSSNNKIDMIESRLNSKVPISNSRLLYLEQELEDIKKSIEIFNMKKLAIENKIRQLKIELNDEENIKY